MAQTEKIKNFALKDLNFDLVGISKAFLPVIHENAIAQWVNKGFAGSMDYMGRTEKKRAHPEEALSGARSVISLGMNYYHPEDPKPLDRAVGKVAQYAYGSDYHKVIDKKLKSLSAFILTVGGAGTEVKSYVDTGPILEKAFAQASGLGFFGKHTNLITRNFGSWVFLASLITNLELEIDEPYTGGCGSCRICIDACPTGALLGRYEMDARRCISYLTIESKERMPEDLKAAVGEWIFGCDVCQEVCPHNCRAKTTRHPEFYPEKKAGTWLDLKEIQAIKSDEEFGVLFQGSPLKRAKRLGLSRNASVVLKNSFSPPYKRGTMEENR
ncbi:MAG: tRNA epoxyqueuosine(34) reductase QueG [Candidatus Omnitrophica bacterium CG1_02_46_14]|nr:MAG: tRNA epoxyqueuosine(34) reductase QueG [Candidatus Omnitrophica bacterium CG1_02_46_14]